jgi:GT2 family glycosyltransferase
MMDAASAVICTRNRPGPIVRAVESLLRDISESIELIVIDQSDGPETERALDSNRADSRLRYFRSSPRGKGAALNEGFQVARHSIVVCTDDDCEVPLRWVTGMARVLQSQPTAAIAFCQVLPVPYNRQLGYVPAFELRASRLVRSVVQARSGLGLGAGMAVRRDFVLSIGGFDESFGPGARFPSADDWDMAVRALLSGRHVYETSELAVVHDGFRTFEEGRSHARRDWMAIGACCAKPLRAGYVRAVVVPLWLFSTRALWPPVTDMLRLRRPSGLARIAAFLQGFARGLMTPVDRKTLRFLDRAN